MSRNYLGVTEQYERLKLEVAQAIYAGTIKGRTPVDQEFYENWAHRYIEWRRANYRHTPTNEEAPKAAGIKKVNGEAKANDLPTEDPNQGRLF